MIPALMLAFILVVLLLKAWPAILINGWGFFTKSVWHTGAQYGSSVHSHGITYLSGQEYGAVPQIIGTLETSAIALIIAVPVSIGAALVVVERLPGGWPAPSGCSSSCWRASRAWSSACGGC